MSGFMDSFSNKLLAFLWEQTLSADLFIYFYENELLDKLTKESLLESLLASSISHIVTLMTISLSIIKDLRRLRSDLLNPKFGSQKSALL